VIAVASPNPRSSILERAWLALSSQRTTAILVIALSILAALTAFIPQGRDALALAVAEEARTIHDLEAWGLTDIFGSAWIRALAALLVANFLASAVRAILTKRKGSIARPPEEVPYRAELVADRPEYAVESLYETFRAMLGKPEKETVDGSRVTLAFETSPGARAAPMLVHVGLILLIGGAALSAVPTPDNHTIVRAILEVKDTSTGAVGTFDIMSGEHFQFFRWPGDYQIVDYIPQKDGLGPAVRIQKVLEKERRSDDFWVYANAPDGFDERHRKGEVAIRAKKLGLVPVPGEGLSTSPAALLLLFGFGLFAFGLAIGRGSEGYLWLEAEADKVTVSAFPRDASDASFAARFSRWAKLASLAIKES
jgi:ResB-like family protein